ELACDAAQSAQSISMAMGGLHEDSVYLSQAVCALVAGDHAEAKELCETAIRVATPARMLFTKMLAPMIECLLACGDLVGARRWADEIVQLAPGAHGLYSFVGRSIVTLAAGELDQAERDAHTALELGSRSGGRFRMWGAFACLGLVNAANGDARLAARFLGAA